MLDTEIFNKFTNHLKNTLRMAGVLARRDNNNQVRPIHLLQGILQQPGSLAAEILHKNGLTEQHEHMHPDKDSKETVTLELSQKSQAIITKMLNIAYERGHKYIGTEHLLMALMKQPDDAIITLLQERNLSLSEISQHVQAVLSATSHFSDITEMFSDLLQDMKTDNRQLPLSGINNTHVVLETLTTDLTDHEIQKDIDPVIGRAKEIDRLIQILARRHKNNPLLLGDPGVGKTAIVEGLAKKIINREVPAALLDKKILHLDLGLMVAGTMYRGEFEARLKNILEEIKHDPNIIIFIDELHNIIGAGSTTGGTMDVANLIKPALARGEIRCIGATTQAEYRKHIESDPALERRFQVIHVNESTPEETMQILKGLKTYYENFHNVTIKDESLKASIDLAVRYIPDKFLPDKAIDLIDEASSRTKLRTPVSTEQKKLMEIKQEIKKLEKEKDQAILTEQYENALKIKNQEKILRQKLHALKERLNERTVVQPTVDETNIAEVVSQITHIPLSYLMSTRDKKLTNLHKQLAQRVIGQDDIIDTVVNVIKRSHTGLASTERPIGSFLFLGPSGVGKTELAKTLALEYFGSREALIRIDMSEFTESFNMSKLLGAPAGYVGYRESGKLTESIRRKPYSVVLFDEIEKGHPDIYNILLQILDEGTLTDGEGKKINFKHTIIIMTSNIASERFGELGAFGFTTTKTDQSRAFDQAKLKVMQELEENFRPELLNRLDTIAIFHPLTLGSLKKIVKLQLSELEIRLRPRGLSLEIEPHVATHLAQISNASQKGAREIRRTIQNLIEQPLADLVLEKDIHDATITITLVKNDIKLAIKQ